ncbi:uncharacterized protein LOC134746878 [Cydia strobilella]|uniref:uncharacterized protein LOC134746878 n=1 Tax=Cydia strobilella TaxID=1100964 RepID=UPI003007C227
MMEIKAEKPVSSARYEIIVRSARSDDVSDIYDIIKLEIPDDNFPPLKHFSRDGFETSPPWFHVLVAERDGKIVGCALYYRIYWPRPSPPGRALLLRMLCVRKSARRCGVGTKLFLGLCRRPSPPGRALLLRMLCVRKSARRCGVGTKLFLGLCRRPSPPGRALLLRMLCVRKSARRCGVGTKLFLGLCRCGALYYRIYWPRPSPPGRALLLRMLCVRKSARRCGVGTKLFLGLCRVALKENAQLNWTKPASDPAAAFFAQFKPDISDDLNGTYIMRISPKSVREIAASKMRMSKDISILMARQEDMAELSMMIREISEIRETLYGRHLNEKDFIEDGFTSSPPWFFALIAWRAGIAVGTAVGTRLYNWERSLDMQSLYVRPEARRCGLAKQLIVEFCRKAEEDGIDHVDFHTHPVNTEALALYGSFGAKKLSDDHGSFRLEVDKIEKILAEK